MKGSTSRLGTRTPGDGCHDNEEQNRRHSPEGIEQAREFLRRHNSYLNAAFVENDDKTNSDAIDNYSIILDDESDFEDDSICELERNICDMSDSDTDEHDNKSDSSDNEGPFCDSDNTVIKFERIIDMFRKVELRDDDTETEDDHIESSMETFVDYCDSDEGMCSLDSDTE